MVQPLLTTKLHTPTPRPGSVPRERLLERLDEGLRQRRRLTLISAPAGFGKTTLVSAWVSRIECSAAWLLLDEGDDDPVRFLHYLIAALQRVDPNVGHTLQQLLVLPQLPPLSALATSLLNDLAAVNTPLVLVLDDVHLVTSTAVYEFLDALLDHLPPSAHLVIITREDPPLALARLRARGQLTELRERDLRFTLDEAAAFFNQTMKLALSPEALTLLEARTEGWIAGLQLAALALQEERDHPEAFITAFAGDNRYIIDYLVSEVLHRLPESTQAFLRQTAILDRLTAPLCDALTGRSDSQSILDQLERTNLFLIPLDHRREWYRYHALFASVLRARLDSESLRRGHQAAMAWYEAHGYTTLAIEHALAAGAVEDAGRLIRAAADATLHVGGLQTVRRWLEALPETVIHADGELVFYKGWIQALSGDATQAEFYASLPSTAAVGSKILVLRAYLALSLYRDVAAAMAFAAEALEGLSDAHSNWQVLALWVMAESLERMGRIGEAIMRFWEVRRAALAAGSVFFVLTVEVSLSHALNYHGQRGQAVALCDEVVRRYTDASGRVSPLAALMFTRLGTFAYEANQLDAARDYHERAIGLSEQIGIEYFTALVRGHSVPALAAQGELETALTFVQRGRQVVGTLNYADVAWFAAVEANLHLRAENLSAARRCVDSAGIALDAPPDYLRLDFDLAYCRLLLRQGQVEDAARRLAQLADFMRAHELNRPLISASLLQALVAQRAGDAGAMRAHLVDAVTLAAPENYIRAFLDESEQLLTLLPHARHAAPAFVDAVLAAAGVSTPKQVGVSQVLVEPLSERELEVLRLIAEGLSNQEIGEKLYIATGTVKRHINHIYGKLDVGSRTQAVARARALRLLDRA